MKKILFFCLITASCNYGNQNNIPLMGDLKPGVYDVGFKNIKIDDQKDISIWYPADDSDNRFPFSRYLEFSEYKKPGKKIDDLSPDELKKLLSKEINPYNEQLPDSVLNSILSAQTMATENAGTASGTFPLLLWSSRNGTAIAQSVMSEYLTSHGYVVAYSRNKLTELMFPWEAADSQRRIAILGQHLSDLNNALNKLKDLSDVDPEKIAVLSWSYGGETATLLQNVRDEVDLVIGLSSNILSGWAFQETDTIPTFKSEKVNVPYILMREERKDTAGMTIPPPEVLKKLPAESYFIHFNKIAHGNFNAIEGFIPSLYNIEDVPMWSVPGTDAKKAYEIQCRLTLDFLNYLFKDQDVPEHFLKKYPEKFIEPSKFGPDSNL